MATWTRDELDSIGAAEEIRIATARSDGSLRRALIVWVVRHDDDLYVRSVNGRDAAWFRGVQSRHEGRIQAGDIEKDVNLVETDDLVDEIDAAYWDKYRRYPNIVPSIVDDQSRAATLKLVPR